MGQIERFKCGSFFSGIIALLFQASQDDSVQCDRNHG